MKRSAEEDLEPPDLRDEFPNTPARRAVVAVVRGFGSLARRMGPHYARFGLTPPQFQMLTVLNRLRGEQVAQRRLAEELYVSFPNITAMLSRLEEAELIERNVNEADRREKFVSITRRGRGLLKRIWKRQPEQLESVTAGLNDAERQELARLLNKMIAGCESDESD
ncbi:MAG: MarR family transcriptional regulator [Planctomycetales bacterium]